MKIFTICDNCNKEFELRQEIYRNETYTKATICPNCKITVHKWIRISKEEYDDKSNFLEEIKQ